MGPALGADNAGAFHHGADRVQRMPAAPGRMGLRHRASLPVGFERQAALQRVDRLAQMKGGHHLGLADPERLASQRGEIERAAHDASPKMDGTGGASARALTTKACVT
jgi:hypothetical protein